MYLQLEEYKKVKATDLIMWNGIDIELYSRSFDRTHLPTVLQFLHTFKWDKNAELALRYVLQKYKVVQQRVKGKVIHKHGKKESEEDAIREPCQMAITGVCRCGGILRGEPLPSCEKKATGRVFVEICDDCPYYAELYWDKGRVTKIEGE